MIHLPRNLTRLVAQRLHAALTGSRRIGAASLRRLAIRVLRFARVRFLVNPRFLANMTRIGHLACEPDCYVKEGILGLRPRYVGVLLVPRDQAANLCLLDYWRKYLWVIRSPRLCRYLSPFAAVESLQYRVDHHLMNETCSAAFGRIQTMYGSRPPLLKITDRHRERGEAVLKEFGIPAGAWFVCVHCREQGFKPNESWFTIRNTDIETYLPAMQAIVDRGGWCIRMGDASMKPLPSMPGVVDYARSPVRSDWMDVFLFGSCRFFLGSCSGPPNVSSIFGVPCALANIVPLSVVYPYGIRDVGIPKRCWSSRENRYLTFPELMAGDLGNVRLTSIFDEANVRVLDNTPEEIEELVFEMLDVVENRARYSEEDGRLQEAFRSLFRPGHYTHGASSRVGRAFLRRHVSLLFPEATDPQARRAG